MLSDRCPVLSVCVSVSLSVTLVHCGQTVGRIKMKLGTQVGFVPGHIVLDGDPAPLPQRGTAPPTFRSISVAAKWLHGSRCTWYGGRPRPRRLCVRWGPRLPSSKRGWSPPPNFRPMYIVAKLLDGSRRYLSWTLC